MTSITFKMSRLGEFLDPKRSLARSVGWLAAGLSLAIAAISVGVGNVARNHLLAERDAVLSAAAKTLSMELDNVLASRLQSLAAAAADPTLTESLTALRAAHPEFQSIGVVDIEGRLAAESGDWPSGGSDGNVWRQRCSRSAWFGDLQQAAERTNRVLTLCTPVVDAQGRTVAIAVAHLPPSWLMTLAGEVLTRVNVDRRARALVLDDGQHVLADVPAQPQGSSATPLQTPASVTIQSLDGGKRQVVVRAQLDHSSTVHRLGLHVMFLQPSEETPFWQGGVLQRQIAWLSLGLSLVAALIGIAFARRLTRRLTDLTTAVKRVETNPGAGIEVPAGKDEVSELGHAFSTLLKSLRHERDALNSLTLELEQRVQARTREIERLSADSRYAAVVRERLKMARDLHDTLAQSMMAMLAEVRVLRKLHTHDPNALAAELERAEQIAHDGLNEARDAISQMRLNVVRDLGLGPALRSAIGRFADRTGLDVAYTSDAQAASFADERAEVVFRIAEEALRNIDRHAEASHVDIGLHVRDNAIIELIISDDGVGFDPDTPHAGHYGVIGMKEQAQLIGAELSLTNVQPHGSNLRLRLRIGTDLQS